MNARACGVDSPAAAIVCVLQGAKIQVLDLPGIIEGAKDGKGRGRQVIGTALTCNAIMIVLDASKPMTHKNIIERELEGFGIRLNKKPPDITFRRKAKGGIAFQNTAKGNGRLARLGQLPVVAPLTGGPLCARRREPSPDRCRHCNRYLQRVQDPQR